MAVTSSGSGQTWDEGPSLLLLWGAFFAGPAAWAFNQGVGYAVMKPVCAAGATYVLWLIAVAALALAAVGTWAGWRAVRRTRAVAVEDGGRAPDRSLFLATVAVALNVLIALLIVTSLIPQFLLNPCE